MDLLATIGIAAAAVEFFSAALSAIGYLRRPSDGVHGIAAGLCLTAGAHAVGSVAALYATEQPIAIAIDRVAWLGLVIAIPTALRLGLGYAASPPSRRVVAVLYATALVCGVLDVVAARYSAGLSATPIPNWASTAASSGSFGIATHVEAVVASVVIVAVAARAYLAGRREALSVVMGATVFSATAVNDLAVAGGVVATGLLVDAGFAAFIAGVMSTDSARLASVSRELERRTQELRTRTSELRRSYEDLRTAQEELVKKEQLAVVGELAAVIAHEVRNPLAIIANAGAGLRKQAISRQDHETLLAILDEETSRLNRLVTDLLRYARPVNVQRSDFSLADVLDRAISLVSKDRRNIKTELKVEGHDGRIWGDSNLLRQVFDNLVVNAVQAMGAVGTLTVRVRAASSEGVHGVAIDIIDTGEGMDTQVRSRARDPFFTTRPSGTGLGLAIVDRIVDAHGGHLAIESRAGEGTTVTVFLPNGSPNEPTALRGRLAKAAPEVPGPAGAGE